MKVPKSFKYCCCGGCYLLLFVFVLVLFLSRVVLFRNASYIPDLVEIDWEQESVWCNSVAEVLDAKTGYWTSMESMIFSVTVLFIITCVAPCFICRPTRRYLKRGLVFLDYETPIVEEISKVPQNTATPKRIIGGVASLCVILLTVIAVPYFITSTNLSKTTTTANAEDTGTLAGYLKFNLFLSTYSSENWCDKLDISCPGGGTWDCNNGQITGTCYGYISDSTQSQSVLTITIQNSWVVVNWAVESYICGTCGGPDCCHAVTKEPLSELRILQTQALCDYTNELSVYTISLTPQAFCKSVGELPEFRATEVEKSTFSMEITGQSPSDSAFSLVMMVPPISDISSCNMEVSSSYELVLRIISFLGSMLGLRTFLRMAFVGCWNCTEKCKGPKTVPKEKPEEEEMLMAASHS